MPKNPDPGIEGEGAPAKLNLYLHVTGRRADGYHIIDSLVAFTDFGDRVSVRNAAGLSLDIQGPFADACGSDDDNLVMRAARVLSAIAPEAAGAQITLHKYLPVASGLGGGSADAASALRQLLRLWRLSPDKRTLDALALQLGADVPVCLRSEAAIMRGIGEQLSPAPELPETCVLLVNPNVALATRAVFENLRGRFSAAPPPLPGRIADCRTLAEILRQRRNDLQQPAIAIVPEIQRVLDMLAAQPGCLLARMSGSGATCFALFENPRERDAASAAMQSRHPRYWLAQTKLR